MDAKDFIRDFYRMCEGIDDCSQCGLEEMNCDVTNRRATDEEIEKTIKVVEKWSKTHPIETNKDVMLRLLPNNTILYEHDGSPNGHPYINISVSSEWWYSEFKGVEYD